MTKDNRKDDELLSDEIADDVKRSILFRGVGYGRAPKDKQFQKGQSGNPKGRPRGVASDLSLSDEPLLLAVLEAMSKTISVKDGGKVSEVPMSKAFVQTAIKECFRGNARYFGIIADLYRTATQAQVREIKERNELWTRIKQHHAELLAQAAARGEAPPIILPHPDDIVIDHETGPRFIGPIDEAGQARMEETLRFRDLLIQQDALDSRSTTRLNGEPLTEPGSALLLALVLERSVPVRHRLSDMEWIRLDIAYDRMSKRELMKEDTLHKPQTACHTAHSCRRYASNASLPKASSCRPKTSYPKVGNVVWELGP